jgi:hypothetical protein
VRERAAGESEETESAFGHIVALTDAYITDCTATRGTLLCTPGQAVTEGQILISGYTDTGLAIRAEQASGEIYGMTRRSVRVVMPEILTIRTATGEQLKKFSLIIGKKRINLWKDSGIYGASCDRMYAEYYITLPGGFRLPLALAVERFGITQCSDREIPANEAETVLSMFAQRSLTQTMIAGSVQERQLEFTKQPGLWILAGEYRCTELIGIMQRLQIGENNGESN